MCPKPALLISVVKPAICVRMAPRQPHAPLESSTGLTHLPSGTDGMNQDFIPVASANQCQVASLHSCTT